MTVLNVQLLLADLAIIIVLARLLGAAARRLGQPPVLGEILAGILLGPSLLHGKITAALFPAALLPPLTALADLGLVLFMFVVGYEVDLSLIRGRERVSASVAAGSVGVPLLLGAALGVWLAHRNHVQHVITFSLFIGTAMAATAFPVLARILSDRGLHRLRIGGLTLASAAAADVLAWTLLAVVVALAGAGGQQWRILAAPVYLAVMFGLVRPALGRLVRAYRDSGRLTPSILATVLTGLLLSCFATNWMGLHFIFGAFLFGMIMPRHDAEELRQEILERLEQVSVLVLLPLYFVVAGLSINLAAIGASGLQELGAIFVVAVAGKFAGSYLGARVGRIRGRGAGAIATLMNTRGLTEIVILGVGLQLHIIGQELFSLMVIMALATTAMSGPLLKLIYPDRAIERDLAVADRKILSDRAAHRILVLIDQLETAGPLVELGGDLAVTAADSELVLAHLAPLPPGRRLEVGTGLGGELAQMTAVMRQLQQLAEQAGARGARTAVRSRFSDDPVREMSSYAAAAEPDTVVLRASGVMDPALAANDTIRLITVSPMLATPATAIAVRGGHGPDGAAALDVAARLAGTRQLGVTVAGAEARRRYAPSFLHRRGIAVSTGNPPEGAWLISGADDAAGAHVAVRAARGEELGDQVGVPAPMAKAGGQQ